MSGSLDLSDGLHESVLDSNCNIGTSVAIGELTKGSVVGGSEVTGCGANGNFKHALTSWRVRQGDVDSTLESF